MSSLLTCSQGHRWEPVPDGSGVLADLQRLCPVCGAAGESISEMPEGTEHIFPDRPGPIADDLARTLPPTGQAPQLISSFTGTIPGYELLGELGRGGMGVIYKARQIKLKRMVALKMVLSGSHATMRELYRFKTEAEAVARLQHPNIVQIYEVGERDGLPYLSLEFVGGGSLAQRMAGVPQPPTKAAELVESLARAIHFAHERGIIHRDLKPANVLMTPEGTPKLADFGLAKQVGEVGLTQTEALMGTPSYMAPEQVTGNAKDVGPAADIYSLGVILYEMLTGQVPFRGENKMATLEQVRSQEPVPPRRLQPRVPRDLDTICLQCLHKEPERRYPTAEAFADDLRRFLQNEPIRARPVGSVERSVKWLRRRPLVAGLIAALVLLLIISYVGLTQSYLQAEAARQLAESERQKADEARTKAETNLYYSQLAESRLEWQANRSMAALTALGKARNPVPHQPPPMEWEWHYLERLYNNKLMQSHTYNFYQDGPGALLETDRPRQHSSPHLSSVVYSPDGKWLATAGGGNIFYESQGSASVKAGEVILRNAATGEPRALLAGHRNILKGLALSPDGQRLASTSDDGSIRIWDTEAAREVFVLLGHSGKVFGAAFSPDGQQLVTGSSDRTMRFWTLAEGQELAPAIETEAAIRSVAFSPDGQRLACAQDDGRVQIWDHVSRQLLRNLTGHTAPVTSVAFSPDQRYVASSSKDGTARVWNAETGAPVFNLVGHQSEVHQAVFRPDGLALATAGGDTTVRVWDLLTGRESLIFRGHNHAVQSVCFHPGGHQLVSASSSWLHAWDLTKHPEYQNLSLAPPQHGTGEIEALAFDRWSDHLLIARRSGHVQERRLGSGLLRNRWLADTAPVDLTPSTLLAFSGDGQHLVTATGKPPRVLKLWNTTTGKLLHTLPAPYTGYVWRVAMSGNGQRIAADGWSYRGDRQADRLVRVWDAASGRLLAEFTEPDQGGTNIRHGNLAMSDDGRWVAYDVRHPRDDPWPPHVKVWDVDRQEAIRLQAGLGQRVLALAFSRDGQRLAASEADNSVTLWTVPDRHPLVTTRTTEPVFDLCFSPNGRRLAGATRNFVALWDVSTTATWKFNVGVVTSGQEVLTVRGAPTQSGDYGYNPRVVFSPDGNWLAANNWNQTVSVWDGMSRWKKPEDGSYATLREVADQRAFNWHLDHCTTGPSTFASEFHLHALKALEPPAAYLAQLRAELFAQRGDWKQTLDDYAAAFRLGPLEDAKDWYAYALLLVHANEQDHYEGHIEQMQRRFIDSTDPLSLAYLVKAAALHSDPPIPSARLVELAEKHLHNQTHLSHAVEALALAHYRHADYRQTLDDCRALLSLGAKTPPHAAWLLLALTQHRLANIDEARRWLAKLEEHRAELAKEPRHWLVQLEVAVLEREGKEVSQPNPVNGQR